MTKPSIVDRFRGLFSSRTDRSFPSDARAEGNAPFGPGMTSTPVHVPPPAYGSDQPQAQTSEPAFQRGYHDHTFRNFGAPLAFEGFVLDRARAAVAMHDQGQFFESSALAIALTRVPSVFAALAVRCAPMISLPRQIKGGGKGLARLVSVEVEEQLCPRTGLLSSPYFPSTLWGAVDLDLAMMGFFVLQHVYGPEDLRGVRRVYTRRWPTWATTYDRYRKTFQAQTLDGPVDIVNDGKFTLGGKSDEPHFQGAIRSLVAPALDAVQVQQARAQWIDRFSDPKLIGFMPPNTDVRGPQGVAFFQAMASIRGSGGYGVFPNGSLLESVGLESKASGSFKDALDSDDAYIWAILTGTDLSPGTGGVYKAPMFWGILRATVGDDIAAVMRGINAGHVYPYTRLNYSEGIELAKARGLWVDPVLDVPLPDPEADARGKSYAERCTMHTDIIKARREAGFDVTQEDSNALATELGIAPPTLSAKARKPEIYQYHIEQKLVAPDEVRDRLGLEPLPGGVGSVQQLAKEREEGRDKTGAVKETVDESGATSGEPAPQAEEAAA